MNKTIGTLDTKFIHHGSKDQLPGMWSELVVLLSIKSDYLPTVLVKIS